MYYEQMAEDLQTAIDRYNAAWNDHDVDGIVALHAPGMVFENHTTGDVAEGPAVRGHIAGIFDAWPDLRFSTRRMYVRRDLVVQEWTATATHSKPIERAGITAEPTGRELSWKGMDVIPFERGLVARKDVYSDSLAVLRGVGLLED